MIIRCPHCTFSRTVDDDKVPPAARTATCPKCHHKFRFRDAVFPNDGEGDAQGHQAGEEVRRGNEGVAAFAARGAAERNAGSAEGFGPGGSEDIWDRVASLGENWLEDDGEADYDEQTGAAARGGRRAEPSGDGFAVPWEQARGAGMFKAFWRTVLYALTRPGKFFSGLSAAHSPALPLLFYFIVTALQTYVFQAWVQIFPGGVSVFGLSAAHTLYDGVRPLYVMLSAPVVWGIFLLAVCFLSVLSIRLLAGGAASLSGAIRVMAYASSPMLFCILPFAGTILGQFAAMLLFAFGCKRVFRLSPLVAGIFILPVYLFLSMLRIVVSGSF